MQDLISSAFKNAFYSGYNTLLVGGYDEPYYLAPRGKDSALICYREDYISSALHEVAHWCIAGPARRLIDDYGYWYTPDGRNPAQQQAFETVELQPQALEWIFSKTIGLPFRISADNLSTGQLTDGSFSVAVYEQVQRYLSDGLPARAKMYVNRLLDQARDERFPLDPNSYELKELTR